MMLMNDDNDDVNSDELMRKLMMAKIVACQHRHIDHSSNTYTFICVNSGMNRIWERIVVVGS